MQAAAEKTHSERSACKAEEDRKKEKTKSQYMYFMIPVNLSVAGYHKFYIESRFYFIFNKKTDRQTDNTLEQGRNQADGYVLDPTVEISLALYFIEVVSYWRNMNTLSTDKPMNSLSRNSVSELHPIL